MKKSRWMALLLAGVLTVLAGCGAKSAASSQYYASGMSANGMAEEMDFEMSEAPTQMKGESSQSLPQNRKWVITMDIDAETENLDAALSAIDEQIGALNGYIESQRVNNGSNYSSRRYRSVSMTVRIPAESVDAFVQVMNSATNVVSNSRNVTDITLTYTDTESRITALRTEETRLLELLAQAKDMSDLLAIESRLSDVRYELENYATRLRHYDNQVDYATVDIYISEVERYTPVEKQSFWVRISTGFVRSIKDLGESIVGVVEWLIVDSPYLVVLGLLGWGAAALTRKLHRRRKEKKAAKAEKQV